MSETSTMLFGRKIFRERSTIIFGKKILHQEFLFEKQLFKTDVGSDCRLAIPKNAAERHFLKHCTGHQRIQVEKEGMLFTIIDLDLDAEIEKKLVFKHQRSTQTYVILGGWKDFVRRGELVILSNFGGTMWRENFLFPAKRTTLANNVLARFMIQTF